MNRRIKLLLSSAIVACVAGTAASAQTQGSNMIEELVVTAQKREESLQDVPVAVSAFTDETRDIVGIRSIQDFATFTPGLSFNAGSDRMSLRGVGRLTNVLGSDPGVAVYADGFYTASNSEAAKSTLFVDRVEILRGPQGTLYGRNSIGGAINVISKRPDDTFGGEVRASIGNYDFKQVEASVSIPLSEGLRTKLGGLWTKQDDGYFKNVAGGPSEGGVTDDTWFEVQVEADLGDNATAWIRYSTSSWDQRGRTSNMVSPYYNTTSPIFLDGDPRGPNAFMRPEGLFPSSLYLYNTPNPGVDDHREFSTNTPSSRKLDDQHQLVAELSWNLGWAALKYIGGYNQYTFTQVTDYDATARISYPTPIVGTTVFPSITAEYIEDKKFWSNELNLSSIHDGPLQWIAGLYYYREKFRQPITLYAPFQAQIETPRIGAATTPGYLFLPAAPNPDRIVFLSFGDLDTKATAAFGQIDYAFNDSFKVTAGLRYSKDEKDALETSRLVYFNPLTLGALGGSIDVTAASGGRGPASRNLSGEWDAWSGTLGAEWSPDTSTMAYAKYSRGYKSGGFNLGALAERPSVEPETLDAYEIGVKKNFGTTLQTNAAVFYYQYEGAQVPVTVVRNAVNQQEFINIAESESIGAELEVVWAPIDQIRVMLNYSYLDATIEKACCIVNSADLLATDVNANPSGPLIAGRQAQDLSGNRLPSSPKNKLALNGTYRFDFEPGSLTFSGTYSWKDKVSYGIFDYSPEIAPSQDQLDLRAIWVGAGGRYTVIGYVRNVFDDELLDGIETGPENGGSLRTLYMTPPRTFGIELQYRF
ncbi:TonB-dependent receptor [Phenylobacterium sp.]|uniref:TonB-dependent receptor n=1 Tax=Phenylobacterium sp. TaxID=1871053 RepID=UPI00273048E5|nr:TonB-dependent receptor [Phenylobacterium sp.]MDP1601282.1 TonB-dependent receptor [Phenylobacterium sp.]MDP3594624.1 TonB-dependent receptor [Phenylobacterium sp.]